MRDFLVNDFSFALFGEFETLGDHHGFQSACHTGPRILATDFHGPTVLTSLHQLILHSFFADSSLFRNYDGSPVYT